MSSVATVPNPMLKWHVGAERDVYPCLYRDPEPDVILPRPSANPRLPSAIRHAYSLFLSMHCAHTRPSLITISAACAA